jgi:hypothetical protein
MLVGNITFGPPPEPPRQRSDREDIVAAVGRELALGAVKLIEVSGAGWRVEVDDVRGLEFITSDCRRFHATVTVK